MADLRFSNQGPIVLGLGGSYPNYASIPSVFGGPTQGILISVYNRGGAYVPNTPVNNLVPTTISTGNPVDWSDYYTSSNYNPSVSPLPPVPNPAPGPGPNPKFDPGITFVQANPSYQAYIGDTYNLGKLITKGVFTNALCTSVLISGTSAQNIAPGQENISFVVQADMNYDINNPADVTVFTNTQNLQLIVSKYFTRYPIDSTQALLSVASALSNTTVYINGLKSLQDSPLPTVTVGGISQTVTLANAGQVGFTVSSDAPTNDSDVVVTNSAGDSTTLPAKFKRAKTPDPILTPIDRGLPPNINWQAIDPVPETLSITVSSTFVSKASTGYTSELVGAAINDDDNFIANSPDAILQNNTTTYPITLSIDTNGSTYAISAGNIIIPILTNVPGLGTGTVSYNSSAFPQPYGLFGTVAFPNDNVYVVYGNYFTGIVRSQCTVSLKTQANQYSAWRILGTLVSSSSIHITGTYNASAPLIEFCTNGNGDFEGGGSRGSVLTIGSLDAFGNRSFTLAANLNSTWTAGTTVYVRDTWVTSYNVIQSGYSTNGSVSAANIILGANLVFEYFDTTNRLRQYNSDGTSTVLQSFSQSPFPFYSQPQDAPTFRFRRLSDGSYMIVTLYGGVVFNSINPFVGSALTSTSATGNTGSWVNNEIVVITNSASGGLSWWIGQDGNYSSSNAIGLLYNYANQSGRTQNYQYYFVSYLNTITGGPAFPLGLHSIGGNQWYLYYNLPLISATNIYRTLFTFDGTTISAPPATQYSITRPANSKYGWNALSLTYSPTSTTTSQQAANAINTLLLTNWGGTVTPTSTVTSDVNGNWTVNFVTNVPAQSNTQLNLSPGSATQSGSIVLTASGGTIGNNITRLSIMNAQNQVYIENNYGYVYGGSSFLTFTHDPDSFDANSAVIQNNFTPTSIKDIIRI
jgi:hypothetical protein